MTNNELSRRVLEVLISRGASVRFADLLKEIGIDPRAAFKNLFFLEEKGLVQLSTSYPADAAVYPTIHLVKLRTAGEEIARNQARMDEVFPLTDRTTDTKPHLPPEIHGSAGVTFHQALEAMARRVKGELKDDERDQALEKIKALMELPIAKQKL